VYVYYSLWVIDLVSSSSIGRRIHRIARGVPEDKVSRRNIPVTPPLTLHP
jgi:hypothetical protein